MSSLQESLAAYLHGQRGLSELPSDLQLGQKDLARHRQDVAAVIANVPEFLIAEERDQWAADYSKLEQRLEEAVKEFRDRKLIEDLAAELPELRENLLLKSLAVREAGWAARGPSSHSGANELLYLLDQIADDATDEIYEFFQSKLEIEFSRFESQAETFEELPEFAAAAMEELLPQYRDILETLSQLEELEDEEFEALYAQLEEWALNFSVYDVDFLIKRYSKVPTQIPSINFALNCQLLLLEELVTEDMADYALEIALNTLRQGKETFLREQSLSAVAHQAFTEVSSQLLEELESLAEIEDKEELKELGGELIALTARLVKAQGQAETEAGSRLDFKSEDPR